GARQRERHKDEGNVKVKDAAKNEKAGGRYKVASKFNGAHPALRDGRYNVKFNSELWRLPIGATGTACRAPTPDGRCETALTVAARGRRLACTLALGRGTMLVLRRGWPGDCDTRWLRWLFAIAACRSR